MFEVLLRKDLSGTQEWSLWKLEDVSHNTLPHGNEFVSYEP